MGWDVGVCWKPGIKVLYFNGTRYQLRAGRMEFLNRKLRGAEQQKGALKSKSILWRLGVWGALACNVTCGTRRLLNTILVTTVVETGES
jgi:hypothetical protein